MRGRYIPQHGRDDPATLAERRETSTSLIGRRVQTPTGRIGVVCGERDGRLDILFMDGDEVKLKREIVRLL